MRHSAALVKRNVLQIIQNDGKTLDYCQKMAYNNRRKRRQHIRSVENLTAFERLNQQIRDHNLLYKEDDEMGRISIIEIRGKITFAYELGLITALEWESLISKVFTILSGV